MRRKLRSSRGETLIEVLCATLVAVLSIALLFGGITASASLRNSSGVPGSICGTSSGTRLASGSRSRRSRRRKSPFSMRMKGV